MLLDETHEGAGDGLELGREGPVGLPALAERQAQAREGLVGEAAQVARVPVLRQVLADQLVRPEGDEPCFPLFPGFPPLAPSTSPRFG